MRYKRSLTAALCLAAMQGPLRAQAHDQNKQPQSLFAHVKAATGGDRWNAIREIDQQTESTQGGQTSHCTRYQDLLGGRNATYCHPAGLEGSYGFDGQHSWFMDEKSLVTENDSIQATRDAVTDAYIARNGWFQISGSDAAPMSYVGEQTDSGATFDVVHIAPEGGVAFDVWIDTNTHRIDRIVEKSDQGTTQTTRYLDYQHVDGLVLPIEQRVSDSGQASPEVISATHITTLPQLVDAHFAMPSSQVTDASIVSHATSATVPFTLYGGYILVELSLNGSGQMPFVLDSGGINLMTPQAAAKLDINSKGQQQLSAVSAVGQQAQIAHVDHYRLGDVLMKDQQFIVTTLPLILTDRGQREPVAGLIGYEILRRFVTHIDYDHHTVTFTPIGTFKPPANTQSVPLHFNERTPQIQAVVDGATGTFNLDTGDGSELTLFASFVKANGITPTGPITKTGGRGVGGTFTSEEAHVHSFTIGGFTVAQPRTSFVSPAQGGFASQLLGGNIGYGLLSRFDLTLDYERHRLYLSKGGHFDQASTTSRSGLGLDRVSHDAFNVISINPGSPAEAAGIRVGDQVVAIDGTPSSQLGLQDVWELSHQAQGHTVTLTIERKGERKSFSITAAASNAKNR